MAHDLKIDPFCAPPRPDVPVETGALILAFARVQMTRQQWDQLVERIKPEYIAGSIDRTVYTMKLWNWMSLWFGCLAVVAEGFESGLEHDRRLTDETLAGLLASPRRAELRKYRNKIFHPERYDHSHITEVVREAHEFVPWAETLTDEFARFFLEYLKSTESSGGEDGITGNVDYGRNS